MPILTFNSIEELPEGLKEFAKADDATGKFTVNVVASSKLDEFRTKNIELSKIVETSGPVMARIREIAGDDIDQFAKDLSGLKDIAKRVKDGELKTSDEIEQAVQDRIKAVRDGYEENAKAQRIEATNFKQRAETLEQRLNRTRISGEVTTAVISPLSGVRPEALPDILERAYRLFKVEDEKIVPKQGEATIYGADGASPMTASEWLAKLREEAPHFFKGNGGGGASGGKEGDKFGGLSKNDFDKLSPLAKLQLANQASQGRRSY